MRHVDAKIKILLVLFYYYNFTFVSIMNCDRQKFSIVTLHESKVHYALYNKKNGSHMITRTKLFLTLILTINRKRNTFKKNFFWKIFIRKWTNYIIMKI